VLTDGFTWKFHVVVNATDGALQDLVLPALTIQEDEAKIIKILSFMVGSRALK
jgi:hypothetical protein